MQRRFVTADVFSERRFGGNPLAVIFDAAGLTSAQMQAIATEFNYSETTFVLPAADAAHTAQVRIFTSTKEVPFAGHPNVGTAVMLAQRLEAAGTAPLERLVFEEAAGLVPIRLLREAGVVVAAELTAPEPLSIGATMSCADTAECLSLAADDICDTRHPPQVLSVGLPFLVAELRTREALRRCVPVAAAHARLLPPRDTDAIFAYVRGSASGELHARMFSPLDATPEDPATGSASGATIARLALLDTAADGERAWRIEQGVDMGRPSLILGRTEKRGGVVTAVHVAGHAVRVMQGTLEL
ncbi:MAG: PhzF family phenazine biosynthesis protein [Proteobacteria bacterium]|nr:PhzF family phenazine biosynthesis protein [Pseudomonadota bacterium]